MCKKIQYLWHFYQVIKIHYSCSKSIIYAGSAVKAIKVRILGATPPFKTINLK